ncbi:hypothetical protein NU10_12010 [Flavobacterium dauae]|uniref:COG1470 family protein n=1 Tax=Flavobacterium dauae TaxID=1563479 RepID=UPI00101CA7D6|nr:hypothetical protein [Flavobacterium dauae]WLD23425.1 hypothetical protein NU10_12010 [Flavobacterium dauae]
MLNLLIRKLLFSFLMLFCFISYAQNGITLDVQTEQPSIQKKNLVDMVVAVHNTTDTSFEGTLKISTPKGFKNISNETIPLLIDAGEQMFVPIKVLRETTVKAGISTIEMVVLNKDGTIVALQNVDQHTEENNNLRLSAELSSIFLTNVNDSLSVKVAVTNLGNRKQDVFVIFSIPVLVGESNFFELKGSVDVQKDTVFDFKLLLPNSLLNQSQFTVNVTGMRSSEKILFGNTAVTVQNVSSVKRYQNVENAGYAQMYQKNSVTASYRTIGKNADSYQLMGSADVDLPAGYVSLNGNFYKNNQQQTLVTNTYLEYHLDNSSIKVGNVNLSSDMPLFGRGVQVKLADKENNRKLEVGFIDENFNLTEKNAFLKNNYGMYATGILGGSNSSDYITGSYIYKNDVTELAQHHLIGIDKTQRFGKNWQGNLKTYGGISNYEINDKSKPVFSVETQYSGTINTLRLSGNYFISSDYFPGNRRGTTQIQQSFLKTISKNRTLYANILFSDFSPQSYMYNMFVRSDNFRFNTGITLPRIKFLGTTFEYQYVTEKSNSFMGLTPNGVLQMKSHRLLENFNWISNNQTHSVTLGIEEGLTQLSESLQLKPQLKLNAIYSFKWLSASAMYQYGSFYLSEYASVLRVADKESTFERLTFVVAADKNFINNKLSVKTGASYVDDFYLGQTPSAFLNVKYVPNTQYQIFLNSSWYRYDSHNAIFSQGKMFIIEAGLTYNFKGTKPSLGRKGALFAKVFYDKNSNNIFDEGDEPAPDYFVTINKTTFKTNNEGRFEYRSLPFGNYKTQPVVQKGWFSEGTECVIDGYQSYVLIPLQQNGTISGKIHYDYDPNKVLNFELKSGGIIFNIFQDGKFIQRIPSNEDGVFVGFLPTGNYQIFINQNSLPDNTYCEQTSYDFNIVAGKITQLPTFEIKVKEKTINVKKFGS